MRKSWKLFNRYFKFKIRKKYDFEKDDDKFFEKCSSKGYQTEKSKGP